MDFEEFKILWQTESHDLMTQEVHGAADIQRMLHQRSQTALARILRNVRIEIGLVMMMGVLAVVGLFAPPPYPAVSRGVGILIGISLFFYLWKYRRLTRTDVAAHDLKGSLSHTTHVMGHYMRLYFYMTLVLAPIFGAGGLFYGYSLADNPRGFSFPSLDGSEIVVLGFAMLIYGWISYRMVRWYIDRLYGKHYRELLACLEELTDSHTDDHTSLGMG